MSPSRTDDRPSTSTDAKPVIFHADRLTALLKSKGIERPGEQAEHLRLPRTYYADLRAGRFGDLLLSTALEISREAGVPVGYLFELAA